MSADTIFGMVVPCFAKIPLRWNTCSLPGPFLDMYKKGARPYRGRKHRRYGHALLRRNDFQLSVSMVLEPYIPGMAGVDSPEGERPKREQGRPNMDGLKGKTDKTRDATTPPALAKWKLVFTTSLSATSPREAALSARVP